MFKPVFTERPSPTATRPKRVLFWAHRAQTLLECGLPQRALEAVERLLEELAAEPDNQS